MLAPRPGQGHQTLVPQQPLHRRRRHVRAQAQNGPMHIPRIVILAIQLLGDTVRPLRFEPAHAPHRHRTHPQHGVIPGRVVRIDPAVENGTVTVDVTLEGKLPRRARPDLTVDGEDSSWSA